MKLLIDTNIYIPLEPTGPTEVSSQTAQAAKLAELAVRTGSQLWLHPAQRIDIAQDQDRNRRQTRDQLFGKYPVLNLPVPPLPTGHTNDWVDEQLVEALRQNAVTALVTEDKRLTKRAVQELGPERVLTLADAIASLATLIDQEVEPPPAVESVPAYRLSLKDPFWDSFRSQYPGFDGWLMRCQQEHRPTWVIWSPDNQSIAGAVIVNHEKKDIRGNKTLKICSLKVDGTHSGRRYGELLLKAVFFHAFQNSFDSLYVTAFPEHQQLIALLEDFGFQKEPVAQATGEFAFTKFLDLKDPAEPTVNALDFFIRRGPFSVDLHGPPTFLVPIWPEYHQMLFPELQPQPSLLSGSEAHGNSLRKAYLSSSNITKLVPGAVLFFYRSKQDRFVNAWGVVEEVMRSESPDQICGFVLPRTVYTREQIESMCAKGPVLAIMFRQVLRRIEPPLSYRELRGSRVLNGPPQSILEIKPEGKEWLRKQCQKLS